MSAGARVGPLAVVGADSVVQEGAAIVESVLQSGVTVGPHAQLERSILVRGSSVGAGSQLQSAIIGEGVVIGAGNRLAGGICVYPDTHIPDSAIQFCEPLQGREGS